MRQILRVVGARLNGNSKLRTEESCTELGDQLFHRVSFATKASGQVTVTTVRQGSPVSQFVQQRGVVGLGRR
jgi:hypothetical protein